MALRESFFLQQIDRLFRGRAMGEQRVTGGEEGEWRGSRRGAGSGGQSLETCDEESQELETGVFARCLLTSDLQRAIVLCLICPVTFFTSLLSNDCSSRLLMQRLGGWFARLLIARQRCLLVSDALMF